MTMQIQTIFLRYRPSPKSSPAGLSICVWLIAMVLTPTALRAFDGRTPPSSGVRARSASHIKTPVEASAAQRAGILMKRALGAYRSGNHKEAQRAMESARRVDPERSGGTQLQAAIALDRDESQAYLDSLHEILVQNPESGRMQNMVGNRLTEFGRADEGRVALKRAHVLEPGNVRFAQDLAAACLAQQDAHEAALILTRTLRVNSQDESLPISLARLYESTGHFEHAAFYYEMASRQHPRNLMLKRQQAHCLYQLEDHARAAALFAESIDGNDGPVSSAELAEYGDACLLTGDYQRAQRIFDEIARAYPVRLKEIELLRGLCAYKLGDTTRASEIVATARTEWPQESRFDVLRQMCSRQEGRGIVTATHVSKIGQ